MTTRHWVKCEKERQRVAQTCGDRATLGEDGYLGIAGGPWAGFELAVSRVRECGCGLVVDLGVLDLGVPDLGVLDLGVVDLGVLDLGVLDLGVCELRVRVWV